LKTLWLDINHIWTTLIHKWWVAYYIGKVCVRLIVRALKHDWSKFSKFEREHFREANHLLEKHEFNSEEFLKICDDHLQPAIEYHYKHNTHHPEYYHGNVEVMQLLDKIEMLCDWKASTKRYKGGDIKESVRLNVKRFGYDEEEKRKMEKFFREINAW